jgi:hypothetical protein
MTNTATPTKPVAKKQTAKKQAAPKVALPDPSKDRAARRAAAKKAAASKKADALAAELKGIAADAAAADVAAKAGQRKPRTKKAAAPPVVAPVVDPAKLDRLERIEAAKVENAAIKAWKAAGSKGDAPATPVLDWMNSADATARKSNGAARKASTGSSKLTPEVQAEVEKIVKAERKAGHSWKKVADALNAAGLVTARGGQWWDTGAYAVGQRLGLPTTAVAAPAKPAVKSVARATNEKLKQMS